MVVLDFCPNKMISKSSADAFEVLMRCDYITRTSLSDAAIADAYTDNTSDTFDGDRPSYSLNSPIHLFAYLLIRLFTAVTDDAEADYDDDDDD